MSARPRTRPRPSSRRSTCVRKRRCATQERENWDFFLDLPELDRRKLKITHAAPAAADAAAVRIQRRVRGLRRDALHQDALAIVRRPRCHRQRHGLLLDLRRQSADHALRANKCRAAGPTWCNSLFEDNAEFGLGFRVSIDKQKEFAGELVKKLAPQLGDDLVDAISAGRPERRGGHLRPARTRRGVEAEAAGAGFARSEDCCCAIADRW